MTFPSSIFFVVLILSVTWMGCSGPSDDVDPRRYPYVLEPVAEEPPANYVDLDGDGRDDRVILSTWKQGEVWNGAVPNALLLRTHDERTIEQVNFAGTLVEPLHFADLERDGRLEIIAPVLRNDSLFYSMVSSRGQKRSQFFVTAGEPRIEPEGEMPWDPSVGAVHLADVTGDGEEELVSVVNTAYARYPRGVWIHDLSDGRLVGSITVGAILRETTILNIDDDPSPELIFATGSPNNGASAGGLDDQHSYIGAFELSSRPRIEWVRELGGLWTVAYLTRADLTGNGRPELVTYAQKFRSRWDRGARLEMIDPRTGQPAREIRLPATIASVVAGDVDADPEDDLLALDRSGVLYRLSAQLEVLEERPFETDARGLTTLADTDGDGQDELILGGTRSTRFLNEALGVQAATSANGRWGLLARGIGQAPYLYLDEGNRRVIIYQMRANPYWWVYRYGPWAGGLFACMLVVGGVWGGARVARRYRELKTQSRELVRSDERGVVLLEPDGTLTAINPPARRVLGVNGAPADELALERVAPELAAFVNAARRDPARRRERIITIGTGRSVARRVTAAPLRGEDAELAGWVVRMSDPGAGADARDYRAWGIMARRLAHDLKNPLTGILLTLQHLQMEYEEVAPEAAATLDPYARRIEDRIEHLRRLTTNFLKFVNLEETLPIPTDLNRFVEERMAQAQADLPSDIDLRLKLGDDLPAVRLDPDQMTSVLDNLTANAVEAMPEGGRLTIATGLVEAIQFETDPAPRDYAVLEVRDTGIGIPSAAHERLFEPGFTTAEDGTGLGLAIVRKVVRDHDGHIDVESEPGAGSVFGIYLPVDEGRADGEDPAAPEPARDKHTGEE